MCKVLYLIFIVMILANHSSCKSKSANESTDGGGAVSTTSIDGYEILHSMILLTSLQSLGQDRHEKVVTYLGSQGIALVEGLNDPDRLTLSYKNTISAFGEGLASVGIQPNTILSLLSRLIANISSVSGTADLTALCRILAQEVAAEVYPTEVAAIGSETFTQALAGNITAIESIDEKAGIEDNGAGFTLPTVASAIAAGANNITSISTIELTAASSSLSAGLAADLIISLKDSASNTVASASGVLEVYSSLINVAKVQVFESDSEGRVIIKDALQPTIAGSMQVKIKIGKLSSNSLNLTVEAGRVAAATSSVAATGAAPADGVASISFSLTLKDQYDNPVRGVTGLAVSSNPNLAVNSISCSEATAGTYTCSSAFSASSPGIYSVTVDPLAKFGESLSTSIEFFSTRVGGFTGGAYSGILEPVAAGGLIPLTYKNISSGMTTLQIDDAASTSSLPLLLLDDGGFAGYGNGRTQSILITNPSGGPMRLAGLFQAWESSASCGNDHIKIYDGSTAAAELLATHCSVGNFEYISSGPSVWIETTADSGQNGNGFAIAVTDHQERSFTSPIINLKAFTTVDQFVVNRTNVPTLPLGDRLASGDFTAVGDEDLELVLSFEGSSTSSFADTSGNGVATAVASPPARRTGLLGKALLLTGSENLPQIPDRFNADNGLSISLWMKRGDYNISSDNRRLISKWGGVNAEREWQLAINSSSIDFEVYTGSSEQVSGSYLDAGHLSHEWLHFAVTYNSTTLESVLYRNGEVIGKTTFTNSIQDTTKIIELGGRAAGTDNYVGYLDEIALWSRPLSADEVLALARVPNQADMDLSYWTCAKSDCSDNSGGQNSTSSLEPLFGEIAADQTYSLIADTNQIGRYLQYKVSFPDPSPILTHNICEKNSVAAQRGLVMDRGGRSSNYGVSDSCGIAITNPAGTPIHMHALEFDMEGSSCAFDYIEIFDGPTDSDTLIGKYCDDTLPGLITSSGSQLYLKFTSDSGDERGGFAMYWEPVVVEAEAEFGLINRIEVDLDY